MKTTGTDEDQVVGDAYESQLETHIDENGNKYEMNEEGQWCMIIQSKMWDYD